MPNMTMTIEDDLLKKARKYAVETDTTVTGLVRGFLQGVADRHDQANETAIAELKRIFDEGGAVVGKRTWTREDLHER